MNAKHKLKFFFLRTEVAMVANKMAIIMTKYANKRTPGGHENLV